MIKFNKKVIALALGLTMLSGCSAIKDENVLTGEEEFNSTATWATLGATSGAAVGGLGGPVGAVIGAAVGGAGGGYYGYSIDLAKEDLADAFENYGVEVEDVNGVINITIQNDYLFDTSEYKIEKDNKKYLDTLLSILTKIEEDFFVKVSGHTDDTGDLKYNISLSESRAKEVAFYLFSNGLKAKSIDYRGFASLKPVASNDTEEGKKLNRRVQIQVIPGVVKY